MFVERNLCCCCGITDVERAFGRLRAAAAIPTLLDANIMDKLIAVCVHSLYTYVHLSILYASKENEWHNSNKQTLLNGRRIKKKKSLTPQSTGSTQMRAFRKRQKESLRATPVTHLTPLAGVSHLKEVSIASCFAVCLLQASPLPCRHPFHPIAA